MLAVICNTYLYTGQLEAQRTYHQCFEFLRLHEDNVNRDYRYE